MKVKQMSPMVHRETFPQRKFCHKKRVLFLLICLHLHLIDHIRKQTFVGKELFTVSFREVGRKVVKEPVFSMDRGFTALLCLKSPP